jgi:predicted  nucleic acid-binding Zn-ribbon protein
MKPIAKLCVGLAVLMMLGACGGVYYSAMEKVGIHKREILVDRVVEARDSQARTKEQFSSALDRFSQVVNYRGGDLEDVYDDLKKELRRSEDRAEDVRNRVAAVEDVADALFDEWQTELGQYKNKDLKRKSAAQLEQTRDHYERLIRAMKKAESKIDPVLDPLRDQVLFLKHNLNARAIASLQTELGRIETDVARLIREMEASMQEADSFVQALKSK